jgi:predicted nuclease with TOPRIM domain
VLALAVPCLDLETSTVEIKEIKHTFDHSSCYSVLSHLCDACVSLKGKLFHATKGNTELKQEVTYLTSRLERMVVSEKIIENDLSRIDESAIKSTYKLGVGFERCENKGEKSAHKFIHRSTTTKRKQ